MFEEYNTDATKFVKEIAVELGNAEDHQAALRIFTSVLHTFRDILTPEESLHLIAQLPLYIKGLYVTNWRLGKKDRIKDMSEFVERLLLQNPRTGPIDFGTDEKAISNVRCVINVLRRHVTPGQIDDMVSQFPSGLKELWEADVPSSK
jgi:uncharacterized protein (DUF2267 family)